MRICHVIDYFHTDVGYQEFYLARDQARAGHKVTVISSAHRQHTVAAIGPDEQLGLDELQAAGVTLVRLSAIQLGHDRAWIRGLEAAIAQARPDAAHVHGPFAPTTVRAVWAARRAGAGVLVDNHIHEAIAPSSTNVPNRTVYRLYRQTAGRYLRRAVGTWVANGPHEARFLSERMGLPTDRVELVPLGFDPDSFCPDETARAVTRADLGVPDDGVLVSVTGKLHPGKRPELVAAACEVLGVNSEHLPTLVLAGVVDGWSRVAVHEAAPRLSAAGRIVERGLLGRAELADLYRASDAVVFARLPSISIYEAAGTGTRVLVGEDPFAVWLGSQCASVEPVSIWPLRLDTIRAEAPTERARRAAAAEAAFGWAHVAERFVERYAAALSIEERSS